MKPFIISFLLLLLLCGTSYGFTDHRFVVNENENGTLSIDSFPEEMNNIPKEHYPHLLICFTKEKGIWNRRGILAGKSNCSEIKINSAEPKIISLMRALDKVLPNDMKSISFSYVLCYHDAVIYFERDYSYGEMCVIAEKLNVERNN